MASDHLPATFAEGDHPVSVLGRQCVIRRTSNVEPLSPYRHARLSTVKVGSDRANAPYVPDGVTSAELREELFSMIARSGVLPTAMSERLQRAEALLEHQGVVNRGANGNELIARTGIRSIERFHFLVLPPGEVSPGGTVWHC